MLIVILALLALVGCGDTVENYYSIAQPDAATTTPDASPDTVVDTFAPDTSQPDTYAPPDVAVDTWAADTWTEPDTSTPDTYVAPDVVDAAPVYETCANGRFVILDPGSPVPAPFDATKCPWDGSGNVLDTKTGLTYARNSWGPAIGDTVAYYADCKEHCVKHGYRMPTYDELHVIIETGAGGCAFPCPWWSWMSPGWMYNSKGKMNQFGESNGPVICVK